MTFKVSLDGKQVDFFVSAENTILDGALNGGITLQYGCSNGRCGDCKAQLLQGRVTTKDNLFEGELLDGEILTCCATPESDIVIDADYFPELDAIKRQTLPAKVDALQSLSDDVMIITLRLPPTVQFDYLPGQYLDLLWNGQKRSYSMAQAGVDNGRVQLHVKKVAGGVFSDFFFTQMQPEQLLRLHGPLGTFFLRESDRPLILLCTGTGFAPIQALLEQLIATQTSRDVFVYWGGRYWRDLYSSLPEELSAQFANIRFYPVLSREMTETAKVSVKEVSAKIGVNITKAFFSGYVQDVVLQHHTTLSEFDVYACGSEKMIASAKKIFLDNGLNVSNFYSDAFTPSE